MKWAECNAVQIHHHTCLIIEDAHLLHRTNEELNLARQAANIQCRHMGFQRQRHSGAQLRKGQSMRSACNSRIRQEHQSQQPLTLAFAGADGPVAALGADESPATADAATACRDLMRSESSV